MKKLLTGLLMLGATSVFAFDFSGEYQLAESESPRGCPSGLAVKTYDGYYKFVEGNKSLVIDVINYLMNKEKLTNESKSEL